MFSTQQAQPTSAPAPIPSSLSSTSSLRRNQESDVRMKDSGGTAGGRKGTSRIKAHRLKGSGIDLYKNDERGSRTSLAARVNAVDPTGADLNIRGASSSRLPASAQSSTGPRVRRNAITSALREAQGTPAQPTSTITGKVVDTWKEFVTKRYDPNAKFLNLENMAQDELLKKHNLISPGQAGASYREGAVIFKIASKLEPEVESISLASNSLKYLSHFNTLSMYLPKLANLSLQNNRIEDLAELDKIAARSGKVSLLREIILKNNPVRENAVAQGTLAQYMSEIRRKFPMLEVLDQEPLQHISFDIPSSVSRAHTHASDKGKGKEEVRSLTFPLPMSGNMLSNEHETLVGGFLMKYLSLFDNARASLLPVYAPEATFSLSANTTIPTRARIEGWHSNVHRVPGFENQTKLEWGGWLESSRNLQRVGRSIEKASKTLFSGSAAIVQHLATLPGTHHTLGGTEEERAKWALEAWIIEGLMVGGGDALMVVVHGQFVEEPTRGIRSFDRSFILAAAPPGTPAQQAGWDVMILSDQLIVRNYSSPRAWLPGPMKVVGESHILDTLTEPQRTLTLSLSARTNLTYTFAVQCLTEMGWDMEKANEAFERVKGQLGREAFNS